jgi:hypothetical protein
LLAKNLAIFICVGVFAGFAFGFYLLEIKNTNQLVYVEGPSISVITEKSDFKKGEEIVISIINSGTTPLNFTDAFYGLKISGLFGILIYSPPTSEGFVVLEPREKFVFSWNQTKNDGSPVLEGTYKIYASGNDPTGDKVEKAITVNIWK